jgi:hypothetical protein
MYNTIVKRANCYLSRSCRHIPSRISDSVDRYNHVINAIQVGDLIHGINSTGACQIGRRGLTESQSLQHLPDRANRAHCKIEN